MARPTRPVRPIAPRVAEVKEVPKAPKVSPQSRRSVFLVLLGLPLFLISSTVLYRRVFEGQPKRVQLGEYTPDGGLRMFNSAEKEQRDSQTWLTRIFGKDK